MFGSKIEKNPTRLLQLGAREALLDTHSLSRLKISPQLNIEMNENEVGEGGAMVLLVGWADERVIFRWQSIE